MGDRPQVRLSLTKSFVYDPASHTSLLQPWKEGSKSMSTVPNTCGSHNFRNGRDPNVLLQHTLLRLVSRPNTKQNKQNKRLGDHVVYPPGYWDINQRRGLLFFRPDVSRTHSSSPSLGDYTPISEGHSTPLRRRKVFKGMRHPDPSPPTRLPVPSLWKDTHSLH